MSNGTTFPGLNQLSSAIANAEGYGVSGAIPTVANNPGNLALGDLNYGTMGQNISVYPDSTSGWECSQQPVDDDNERPKSGLQSLDDVAANGHEMGARSAIYQLG